MVKRTLIVQAEGFSLAVSGTSVELSAEIPKSLTVAQVKGLNALFSAAARELKIEDDKIEEFKRAEMRRMQQNMAGPGSFAQQFTQMFGGGLR